MRTLKTPPILWIRSMLKKTIDTPTSCENYIGLFKPNKSILFEITNQEPQAVWKKEGVNEWVKSEFLGYQLISEYTIKEFQLKREVIKNALQQHWDAVNKNPSKIHGDLTHFNILNNQKKELYFIDQKSSNHSKLFDFFYFFAYYSQCLNRCATLEDENKIIIINDLKSIIKNICQYDSNLELEQDVVNMNMPSIHGLNDLKSSALDFHTIFE